MVIEQMQEKIFDSFGQLRRIVIVDIKFLYYGIVTKEVFEVG